MKIYQKKDLFLNKDNIDFLKGYKWDAYWIKHPNAHRDKTGVYAYLLKINLINRASFKIHISADQRYKLYIDNKFEGLGTERSDLNNWAYDTYKLNLKPGEHSIFVFTWYIAPKDHHPIAQITAEPGFILCTEDLPKETVSTGFAPWKVIDLSLFYPIYKSQFDRNIFTGSRFGYKGKDFPLGYETGNKGNWTEPTLLSLGEQRNMSYGGTYSPWQLKPSTLPPEKISPIKNITILYADQSRNPLKDRLMPRKNIIKYCNLFDNLINNNKSITIPPHTTLRVILDLNNYYCIYTTIKTTAGLGSSVNIAYEESLYETDNHNWFAPKGNRNEWKNKYFAGEGEVIEPGGEKHENFETPWWKGGRFIQISIKTEDTPLTINSLKFKDTHYNFKWESYFDCDNKKWTSIIPMLKRSIEMCTHETLMDCPYYEEQMYPIDSRISLHNYYISEKGNSLPLKVIDTFHNSLEDIGMIRSNYPSSVRQFIPGAGFFWIGILYDYALFGYDLKPLQKYIFTAFKIINYFEEKINKEGLLKSPKAWNFLDWVPGFVNGSTKEHQSGISGQYNIHLIYTIDLLVKLLNILNEKQFAERYKKLSHKLAKKVLETFWDKEQGAFADDKDHTLFLEHTQCLAILSDHFQDKIPTLAKTLTHNKNLIETTISYKFYLFEAAKKAGFFDIFKDKINYWLSLLDLGFKTTPEQPEPTRSDCHAWGSHPYYFFLSGILGINPAEPGFKSVRIKPNLFDLSLAEGAIAHKKGLIKVKYKKEERTLFAEITLPKGLRGTFEYKGKETQLSPGENKIKI